MQEKTQQLHAIYTKHNLLYALTSKQNSLQSEKHFWGIIK